MKTRDMGVYIAAGVVAGALLVWGVMRVSKPASHASPAAAATAAASSPLSPPAESLDAVPRISQDDFKKRLEGGEIVVIDVRGADDYTGAHIPGAIHIPLSFIQGELPYLPRGKPIVTYCT